MCLWLPPPIGNGRETPPLPIPPPQQLLRSVGKDSLDFTSEFAKARPAVLEADTTFLDLQDHQAVLPRDQSIAFGILASDERSIVGIGLVWVSGILL